VSKLLSIAAVIASLAAGAAWAQAYPPNEAGVTMGHWHRNSHVDATKKILVAMGGTAIKPGDFDIVRFPVSRCTCTCAGWPARRWRETSALSSTRRLCRKERSRALARWKAAGVPVEPGNNNRVDQAFVVTPDGLRIEILKDKTKPCRSATSTFIFTCRRRRSPRRRRGTRRSSAVPQARATIIR
jgi:hypothetical protein